MATVSTFHTSGPVLQKTDVTALAGKYRVIWCDWTGVPRKNCGDYDSFPMALERFREHDPTSFPGIYRAFDSKGDLISEYHEPKS